MFLQIMFYTFITVMITLLVSILYGVYTLLTNIGAPTWVVIVVECVSFLALTMPIICSGHEDIISQ